MSQVSKKRKREEELDDNIEENKKDYIILKDKPPKNNFKDAFEIRIFDNNELEKMEEILPIIFCIFQHGVKYKIRTRAWNSKAWHKAIAEMLYFGRDVNLNKEYISQINDLFDVNLVNKKLKLIWKELADILLERYKDDIFYKTFV